MVNGLKRRVLWHANSPPCGRPSHSRAADDEQRRSTGERAKESDSTLRSGSDLRGSRIASSVLHVSLLSGKYRLQLHIVANTNADNYNFWLKEIF